MATELDRDARTIPTSLHIGRVSFFETSWGGYSPILKPAALAIACTIEWEERILCETCSSCQDIIAVSRADIRSLPSES